MTWYLPNKYCVLSLLAFVYTPGFITLTADMPYIKTTGVIFAILMAMGIRAQTLSGQQIQEALDSVTKTLLTQYVFPDKAQQMVAKLHQQQKAGLYKNISDANSFAAKITTDLRSVYPDQHLKLEYAPQRENPSQNQSSAPNNDLSIFLKKENYGISKVEILKGNIGYVDFGFFCWSEEVPHIYSSLMNYLAHTDALILDLRRSRGTLISSAGTSLLCAYFFKDSVHFGDQYAREGNRTTPIKTPTKVSGEKYLDKPIYLLTSNRTFSGAEQFAYDLKNFKRATLIGETTRGGAHPTNWQRINSLFSMTIPVERYISTITQTDWEGTGVQPDTAVKANRALYRAHLLAVQQLQQSTKNEAWQQVLKETETELKNNPPVFRMVKFELPGYESAQEVRISGSFNNWPGRGLLLERNAANNTWSINLELEPGKMSYKFMVDGKWVLDPNNPQSEEVDGRTNSVKVVQ